MINQEPRLQENSKQVVPKQLSTIPEYLPPVYPPNHYLQQYPDNDQQFYAPEHHPYGQYVEQVPHQHPEYYGHYYHYPHYPPHGNQVYQGTEASQVYPVSRDQSYSVQVDQSVPYAHVRYTASDSVNV